MPDSKAVRSPQETALYALSTSQFAQLLAADPSFAAKCAGTIEQRGVARSLQQADGGGQLAIAHSKSRTFSTVDSSQSPRFRDGQVTIAGYSHAAADALLMRCYR